MFNNSETELRPDQSMEELLYRKTGTKQVMQRKREHDRVDRYKYHRAAHFSLYWSDSYMTEFFFCCCQYYIIIFCTPLATSILKDFKSASKITSPHNKKPILLQENSTWC